MVEADNVPYGKSELVMAPWGKENAHTSFTWSHGDQFTKDPAVKLVIKGSSQFPGTNAVTRADWQKFQGPPAAHYALAKANGHDFYVSSDHSQDAGFQPVSATNENWVATKQQAALATDVDFIAIAGYEHSENNGPDGTGHLNVINSAEYLNALAPGVDLKFLYHWLEHAAANGDGPVVASFNHPGAKQYNDWAYRDPAITGIITMLEVINSNKSIHYDGFIHALDHGWKVSPVCGNDNHGFFGITHHRSRTFVLSTSKTKAAILDAMKNRRTYAALDPNIQCRYTVNGAIMGSTLEKATNFHFNISIADAKTKITKLDIVKDGGVVVKTYKPEAAHAITWQPDLTDATNKYFFIRVWTANGGEAPGANPTKPMAWLAPVWTGR